MKKYSWLILISVLIIAISVVVPSGNAAYAAEITDAPVMVLSATMDGKEVTVDAVLKRNSGISGMTVEIEYDASAMTLTNVERGNALSSLEYLTTNTEQGYSHNHFRINWSGDENDTSTGTILKMRFSIKETTPDGEYLITLKGVGEKPVSYLTGNQVETKRILIDGVKIRVSGDEIEAVATGEEIKETEEKKPNIPLIVGLSVTGGVIVIAAVACVIVFVVMKKGKKKSWEEIKE